MAPGSPSFPFDSLPSYLFDGEEDDETDHAYEVEEDIAESGSEEYSSEVEEDECSYEYHYDDEIGDYVALSSPSLSPSAQKEYRPDSETHSTESEGGHTAKHAREISSSIPKKKSFEKVWSDGDEINILKDLLEYAENKRADPVSAPADVTQFYKSFKASFHRQVTRVQLAEKVRRLKKKFKDIIARKRSGQTGRDKDPTSSKPHETELFQLSNKIWGGVGDDIRDEPKCVLEMHKPSKNLDFDGLEDFLRDHGLNLDLLDENRKATLEEKWNQFRFSALVTFSKEAAFRRELMQQALDASRSGRF
ncbi:Mediator-associated protein 1 [Morella rubra]|uniref:Mediator-associated protein 1 n=1 Tax=Morella rubra TaxID=262757 RepID=A0A6A1WMX0_9ROSI|nr:Mediator-associated protein 1 [Morella rubra]